MNAELQTVHGGFPPDALPANQEPRRIKDVLAHRTAQGGEECNDEREPLPVAELPAVPALEERHMPRAFWPFVCDEAERVQAPPDYVAAALLAVSGALAACFACVLPKNRDDSYRVWPNAYTLCVGTPGARKTPAARAAMQLLAEHEDAAHERWEQRKREWNTEREAHEIMREEAKKTARSSAKGGAAGVAAALAPVGELADEPAETRLKANWTTPEKLFALWATNPAMLLHRDEGAGLFDDMDRRGYEALRSLLTEGFNGDAKTSDTKSGGTVRVRNARPSIFGTIQPEPLRRLQTSASIGRNADGLMQRFQAVYWPDDLPQHDFVNRPRNEAAAQQVRDVVERLATQAVACIEGGVPVQQWRFDEAAQESYARCCNKLDALVRATRTEALQSHFNKTAEHVAKLALLFQLVDAPNDECLIGLDALSRAADFVTGYLRWHVLRFYGVKSAAAELKAKLEAGKLSDGFTLRDVYESDWRGLKTKGEAQAALDELVRCRWLHAEKQPTGERGGRPTVRYRMCKTLLRKREGKK